MADSQEVFNAWASRQKGWNPSRSTLKTTVFDVPLAEFKCLAFGAVEVPTVTVNQSTSTSSGGGRGCTCITCGMAFVDFKEQQTHFKSDEHVENLRRKLAGKDTKQHASGEKSNVDGVGEDDAAVSSEDDSDGSSASSVENDAALPVSFSSSAGSITRQATAYRGPTFHIRDAVISQWEMVVSGGLFPERSIFSSSDWAVTELCADPLRAFGDHLQQLQSNPTVAVFLLRSGRFAGAVFSGTSLLIHKVARRYTVRAKAGGGQSSHDNKHGKAKSAGAMMRRHGEQALREDVAACLRLWAGHIQSCSLVLISAPKTMRSDLFVDELPGSGGAVVLSKEDPRICYVPFMVGKPTLEEARAVHDRCTSVYFNSTLVSQLDGDSVPAPPLPAPSEGGQATVPQSSKALKQLPESATLPECPASQRLFHALRTAPSGEEEEVLAVLEDLSADPDQVFETYHHQPLLQGGDELAPVGEGADLAAVVNMVNSLEDMSTALHLAAEAGMAAVVGQLLALGASPLTKDVRGRLPYGVAKDKETRDAFRRYRGTEEGESRWDWSAAGVGAALTEDGEKLQKQREKEKEKEKKKRAAQRKKEAKAKEEQQVAEAAAALERQRAEEQARVAAARESAGVCAQCGASLFGRLALDLYDRRCCSADCVLKLRRRLAADAATKRFQQQTMT